jgi:hypothetical protein
MGRNTNPLPTAGPAVTSLKEWLRGIRGNIPLSELAQASHYSKATLSEASGGTKVPRRNVVLAYAKVCAANEHDAEMLWAAARLEDLGLTSGPDSPGSRMRAELISTPAELATALKGIMILAGIDGIKEMVAASARDSETRLSRVTISRTLTGATPPTSTVLKKFLTTCEVVGFRQDPWFDALDRINYDLEWSDVDEFSGGADEDDTSSVVLPVARPADGASGSHVSEAILVDLQSIRRGRGLMAPQLSRYSIWLRQACKITDRTSTQMVRDEMDRVFREALDRSVPDDLNAIAVAVLNLPGGPRGTSGGWRNDLVLGQRIKWCADRAHRDQRTIRRRADEALRAMAEYLADAVVARLRTPANSEPGR